MLLAGLKVLQLPAALNLMGTSTIGLDFSTAAPLIWQYARAFFNDVSPILIWVIGAIIAFFVATKLIDILSGNTALKTNKRDDADLFYEAGDMYSTDQVAEDFVSSLDDPWLDDPYEDYYEDED